MYTMLLTRQFKTYRGSNALPIVRAMANFFRQELNIACTIEQPWQKLKWADFDFIYQSPGRLVMSDDYHVHYANELQSAIARGQKLLIDYDDVYFPPLSVMRQLGFDDTGEFTHATMLNDKTVHDIKLVDTQHPEWQSQSVKDAVKLICPIWTLPDASNDLAIEDPAKVLHRALYTGHAKSDRSRIIDQCKSIAFGTWHYHRYLAESSNSLALVMMNSESHGGCATLRFYESAAHSIQLWPVGIHVKHFKPRADRTFSCNDELDCILAELSAQTVQQRRDELLYQQEQVHFAMQAQLNEWRNANGKQNVLEALCR